MSASKYCKLVMTNHQPKYRLKQKHLELLQDVRKIANDLQRIANFFKNKKYAELMKELKKIIDTLKQLLYDCNS